MELNRQIIKTAKLSEHQDDNYYDASIAERINMVWPLTEEISSLSPQHNVERRLQRHIAVITKRRS